MSKEVGPVPGMQEVLNIPAELRSDRTRLLHIPIGVVSDAMSGTLVGLV